MFFLILYFSNTVATVPIICRPLENLCENGRICLDNSNEEGELKCECNDGFIYNSDSRKCEDINECKENRDVCTNGDCQNIDGGFSCHCNNGFTFVKLNATCRDIDECHESDVCRNGVCQIKHSRFICSCEKEELIVPSPSGPCNDKEECFGRTNICLNGHCTNMNGSYTCLCWPGFQKTGKGICTAIHVPTSESTDEQSDPPATTPSIPVDSSATTSNPLSTESQVLEAYQSESSTVPLPAIVVPVILISVGLGLLGAFLWRKRCLRNKKSDHPDSNSENKHRYENSANIDTSYDSLQGRDPIGIEYSCIDIEPENTYSSIDIVDTVGICQPKESREDSAKITRSETLQTDNHDYLILEAQNAHASIDNKTASSKVKDVCSNEAADQTFQNEETEYPENHNYFVIDPHYSHLSFALGEASNQIGAEQDTMAGNQTSNQQCGESNNYFILESHASDSLKVENGYADKTSRIKPTEHASTLQMHNSETEDHNYFVLESQDLKLPMDSHARSHTDNTSNDGEEIPDNRNADNAVNHNYFVLEPQNTAPSLDSRVFQLQTMPDNEYNVLNMKSKVLNQARTVDALKSEDNLNQAGGDYSHIVQVPKEKNNSREYSH